MIENVIVTVRDDKKFSVDMELPAQLLIKELSKRLPDILKELSPDTFDGLCEISLFFNERELPKDSTLEAEEVWDGRIITVR